MGVSRVCARGVAWKAMYPQASSVVFRVGGVGTDQHWLGGHVRLGVAGGLGGPEPGDSRDCRGSLPVRRAVLGAFGFLKPLGGPGLEEALPSCSLART